MIPNGAALLEEQERQIFETEGGKTRGKVDLKKNSEK